MLSLGWASSSRLRLLMLLARSLTAWVYQSEPATLTGPEQSTPRLTDQSQGQTWSRPRRRPSYNAKAEEDKRWSNELILCFEWTYVHNFICKRLWIYRLLRHWRTYVTDCCRPTTTGQPTKILAFEFMVMTNPLGPRLMSLIRPVQDVPLTWQRSWSRHCSHRALAARHCLDERDRTWTGLDVMLNRRRSNALLSSVQTMLLAAARRRLGAMP